MTTGIYIVAEAGMNHDGSIGTAGRLVDVAAECGADAVKFQTHIAAAETIVDAPTPPYFSAEPRYGYFERTAFTRDQWRSLRARCEERGVDFLSLAVLARGGRPARDDRRRPPTRSPPAR